METRYGRLTITKYYVGGAVRCVCDCGKEFVTERLYIHNGSQLDCGCGIASTSQSDRQEAYPIRLLPAPTLLSSEKHPIELLPIPANITNAEKPAIGDTLNPPDEGYVYILLNRALPGIVKIGKTTKLPEKRAAELSTSSGVPLPYQVYYAIRVSNCHGAERVIHKRLAAFRDNLSREFFNLSPENAREAVESIISSLECL
jgi:hypothetical protein